MKQLKKGDSRNIASLIFNVPHSVLSELGQNETYDLSEYKRYFFAAEMSFFLFYWIVSNCLQRRCCGKDFAIALEKNLANLFSKKLKGSSKDYRVLIRNRFSRYRSVQSDTLEGKAKERENVFLQCLKDDIEKGAFSSFIPEPTIIIAGNLLHAFLYNACLKEFLKKEEMRDLL